MAKNYAGITDTGKQRSNNEDAFVAAKLQGNLVTACVIDGLGGYEGGEVAAAIAKDAVTKKLSGCASSLSQCLTDALLLANNNIIAEKQKNEKLVHMSCVLTLAVADCTENKLHYAHVGDTRLYLFRDQSLVKITRDQSFVGFLEDNGRISEAEAMAHPKRNEINKALGFELLQDGNDYFETGESPFLPGDTILLCSDGLTDMINSAAIVSILNMHASVEEKSAMLVQAANDAGGHDNITVVLVQHDKRSSKQFNNKTIAQKKTTEVTAEAEPVPGIINIINKRSGTGWLLTVSIALAVALLAIAWLLFHEQQPKAVMPPPVNVSQKNIAEKTLADSLQLSSLHEVSVLPNASKPITISDTIFIDRDTVILHGNGLRLQSDSAFNGPVFVLGNACRYMLIDSVQFENFSTAIIANKDALHLQSVQFVNCRLPVLYQLNASDSSITKKLLRKDSTHNNQH